MPLLKFHLYEGKSPEQIQTILDVAHDVMVEAFEIHYRDRYQMVHEHKKYQMIMQDTGLGFERTDDFLLIHVFSRKRTQAQITTFYHNLARDLQRKCHIQPHDVMVSIASNEDEDWSFGEGRAQFLTGEL
ncbi:tautomerase family protein [Salibacterium aidingense]|uniref:tautomerase family protein n=1 Tax=Salibacterium aidingense TaxID=384933 RepID=UPI00047C045A|nr:tautomerase family protein [Salibacterium aidingense]